MNQNKNTHKRRIEQLRGKKYRATPKEYRRVIPPTHSVFCDECEQRNQKDKSDCEKCYGAS